MSAPLPGLPITLSGWEAALVRRFLRADGDDASPIRALEVTGDTLATAVPEAGASGNEAEEAFRIAIRSDRHIWDALREGRRRPSTNNSPNCFAYLCMSLLIDTLLDGKYSEHGQFRYRLRTWLDTTRTMTHLSGIATMWRDLSRWLDQRIAAGEDYRRLILPDPRTWTQIGYTRRLSFPTRSDLRFLERVLAGVPRGTSDRPGLLRAIEAAIHRDGASWGMEAAFAEFRDAFRAGGASADHRFWRLVLRSARAGHGAPEAQRVRLEIEHDEDGRRFFTLEQAPQGDLGTAMRRSLVVRSENLSSASKNGVVFFRRTGMARWLAEAEPPPGSILVGVAAVHLAHARAAGLDLAPSGDWLLTKQSVGQERIDDLLLRVRLTWLRQERLIDFSIDGGVRTAGGFLGRKRFLPHVNAADREVAIRRLPGQKTTADATCICGAIVSNNLLDGRYELSVSSHAGEAPEWTRRIRFLRDALPHAEAGGAAEREPPVAEWRAVVSVQSQFQRVAEGAWEDLSGDAADLCEAIYAAGRTGLSDAGVIDLVRRGCGGDAVPWDVLRAIQESGFITARRRSRWRGRVWTLGPPHLFDFGVSTVLIGATCAAMQEEFRRVAEGAGGRPFRRFGPSIWSPPILGAWGVTAAQLSDTLGWRVTDTVFAPELTPGRLETCCLVAEHYIPASRWDWTKRRFVRGAVPEAEVTLIRWVHPGGSDHDQYRVCAPTGETRHATRNAAILQAHIAAKTPLFTVANDVLLRTDGEGALPLEIARWLRLRAGLGSGPLSDGNYIYPIGNVSVRTLAAALPGCIQGAPPSNDVQVTSPATMVEVCAKARRSGGRVRLQWHEGRLTAK